MKNPFRTFVALAVFLFAACKYEGDTITVYKDAEEESTDFVSEALALYDLSDVPTGAVNVRFYNDNRYVPYVGIRYFLEKYASFALQGSSYADGKYKYENRVNGKNFPIIADVKKDTLYCPEWAGFRYSAKTGESSMTANETLTSEKSIKIINTYSGQKAQTFDLTKYGMKIYGSTNDAYIPLVAMNILFLCVDYEQYIYNGNNVYHFTYDDSEYDYENFLESDWYKNSEEQTTIRPKELVELSYNSLCFMHDYMYGHPGYYGFADQNGYPVAKHVLAADSLNFDEMLKTYMPGLRTNLKSSSYDDYFFALFSLIYYVYGDLHTSDCFEHWASNLMEPEVYSKAYSLSICSQKYQNDVKRSKALAQARIAASKATKYEALNFEVLSGKKTAVIRFDVFEMDYDAWAEYYNGSATQCPDPETAQIPDDSVGIFYKAFYKLLNDSSYSDVENVIIDISCNGGGDEYALYRTVAYLIKNITFRNLEVQTNSHYADYITTDLNLDGLIDEDDDDYFDTLHQKFNFAVLTSLASFSCGNAFPVLCQEAGIPIIGERSGGGACVVGMSCTADGFMFCYSANARLSHADWSSVEDGAPITSGCELTNAADFYDDAKLQAIMDSLFTE